jgi:membrane protease YdiL (CAAX protease family)
MTSTRSKAEPQQTTSARLAPSQPTHPAVEIPQYTRRQILSIWACAAVPMAALSWLVAPALQGLFSGDANVPLAKSLFVCLTLGLVWQFVMVALLVRNEQGNLHWSTVREALWLRAPRSPRSGRRGGWTWLLVVPLVVLLAAEELIPKLGVPADRDFGLLLGSDVGQAFLHGSWGWYALLVAMWVFNTVLGEELLFRGLLLPRMNGAFGSRDWLANGVLFAVYHLHVPWAILPALAVDTFIIAYPSKRYQSAWIGIVVHSAQSVFLAIIVLTLVV